MDYSFHFLQKRENKKGDSDHRQYLGHRQNGSLKGFTSWFKPLGKELAFPGIAPAFTPWFKPLGQELAFIFNEGAVQACKTSAEEINIRI